MLGMHFGNRDAATAFEDAAKFLPKRYGTRDIVRPGGQPINIEEMGSIVRALAVA